MSRTHVELSIHFNLMRTEGIDWSIEAGVPAVGLLTSVLLNFYLDYFDPTFINRFPHLPFVRYIHEIIVAVPPNLNNLVVMTNIN